MYITCIYHNPLHKIGLKDNIFKLHLYKVYIIVYYTNNDGIPKSF